MPTRKRSGTPSAASSTSRPLESLVWYLDESLDSPTVAAALTNAGARVVRATQKFPRGTADEVWLTEAGKQGWVVLTRDKRIRYRMLERMALEAAGVRAFVFTGGNVTIADTAALLAAAIPAMDEVARSEAPPFIFNIGKSGLLIRVR